MYIQIKEIWCNLLQTKDIRPNADLRSLGADSLIMAQAVGKIRTFLKESEMQCDIPFDVLVKQTLNSSTLHEIVLFIERSICKKDANNIYEDVKTKEGELGKVRIHKKDSGDKLVVLFHAGLGTIEEFLPFIQSLCNRTKGTVVSIALNNVERYLNFHAERLYESVADNYTQTILNLGYANVQLIGHCVGGMIAFEVAKNLLNEGVEVVDVSLIDSIPGEYSIRDEVIMELMFLPMINIKYPILLEYQLNGKELYKYMEQKFGLYEEPEQKINSRVEEYNRKEQVIRFWKENCIGNVSIITIPGNHLTCVAKKSNIDRLVDKIVEK